METVIKTKRTIVLKDSDVEIVLRISNGDRVNSMSLRSKKISPRTIEQRIAKMLLLYNCKTTPHLVATFLRKGIIK